MSTQIGLFKHEMLNMVPPSEEWLVLSLTQPWSSALFAVGQGKRVKTIETRSWRTNYRGRLYIHAAKGFPKAAKEFATVEHTLGRVAQRLPFASIIGHIDLTDIRRTSELIASGDVNPIEKLYGDYGEGRYGWITTNPVLFDEPIPARGSLGLWKFSPTKETPKP